MNESDNNNLEEKVKKLEFQVQELMSKLAEKDALLKSIYASKTWKLGQLYGRLSGSESSAYKIFNSFLNIFKRSKVYSSEAKKITEPVTVKASESHYSKISSFINDKSFKRGIFVVFAHPKISNTFSNRGDRISHRAVRLVHEFGNAGCGIVYAYTETNREFALDEIETVNGNIIQMNIKLFFEVYKYIFENTHSSYPGRVLLIEGIHPKIPEVLGYANASNWTTVYDIIDNWEEFQKQGWRKWYCKRTEEFVVNNADIRITVSDFLKKKFSYIGDFHVVPNGYVPYQLLDDDINHLPRGTITAGYIGNLEKYRFDWDLLLAIAEKHLDWKIYLIGSLPKTIKLPNNVISLGLVIPSLLSAYAKNWDVGIIPFKINDLTLSCDNLKVYEYLYFGLPVVAIGAGEHIKDYPYVYLVENAKEFERHIENVPALKFERDMIAAFLKETEWSSRANEIIKIIGAEKSVYKEYIFEGPVHS